jgi:glycerol-3-phosphate dehydrogenase
MNVSLAMTAALYGATVVNHMEVTALTKDARGKLVGAKVKDRLPELDGKKSPEFEIRARGVINATGPFCDSIRKLDDPSAESIVAPSLGVHVTLPGYYSPANMGLIDPSTSDGRVIFFLPWQGNTIAGTTDAPTPIARDPVAGEDEIEWILSEIRGYLQPDINVRRGDVLAAWAGIRPLVRDPKAKRTEGLVRNHLVTESDSGLITVAGGKWTTYREMAEETVDAAVRAFSLTTRPLAAPPRVAGGAESERLVAARLDGATFDGSCQTHRVRLAGAHGWSRTLFIALIQHFGLETEVAAHLAAAYGDRAWSVAALCAPTPAPTRFPVRGRRLSPLYPFVDGEVRHAVRHECAARAADVLARRTRLAFLNAQAALEALPAVIDIMAEELRWSGARREREWADAVGFLRSMGLPEGKVGLTRRDVERGMVGRYPGEFVAARNGPAPTAWDGRLTGGADEEYKLYARHDKPAGVLETDR